MTKKERYEQEKNEQLARVAKIQGRVAELNRLIQEETDKEMLKELRVRQIDAADLKELLRDYPMRSKKDKKEDNPYEPEE